MAAKELTAEEIIQNAEKSAEKMIKDAEKRIEKMLKEASTLTKVSMDNSEEEYPEYLKKMQEDMKEKTNVTLFNDGDRYKDDQFISINGNHRYQIRRGVSVAVPKFVAEIEKASRKQDQKTARLMMAEQEKSMNRMREM